MASSQYSPSLRQAFNFEKDSQVLVGHLVSLNIGTIDLPADLDLDNPKDVAGAKLTVVGAITDISWEGGYADPVHIRFNVSNANQVSMLTMKHQKLVNTEVVFKFVIYAYDQVESLYYEAFWSDDGVDMNGLLLKNGGALAIDIAEQEDPTVKSPDNYNAYLGIVPQNTVAQALLLAFSNTAKLTKVWGVKGLA